MKQTDKSILITGGGGFIGSNLIFALQKKHKIICLDRGDTYSRLKKNINKNVQLVQGDITDESLLDQLIKNSYKIIHLAGGGGNEAALADPVWAVNTHILGTYLLLKKSRQYKIRQLIFASSYFVYGGFIREKSRLMEGSALSANTFYGLLKKIVEMLIKDSGVNYTILRLANVYGNSHLESLPDKGALYKFIRAAIQNKPIEIYGSGKQFIDYVHVQDVIQSIILALNYKKDLRGQIYNIGSGHRVSIIELACIINDILKKEFQREVKIKKSFVSDDKIYSGPLMSIMKAEKYLGWHPQISLREGVKEIILRYKSL